MKVCFVRDGSFVNEPTADSAGTVTGHELATFPSALSVNSPSAWPWHQYTEYKLFDLAGNNTSNFLLDVALLRSLFWEERNCVVQSGSNLLAESSNVLFCQQGSLIADIVH